ncbi:MAG: DUF1501 domain-containing protein [Myxococcota bacterium]|nr:DUF1501 domain-containing protein [Myxococcota bacterium]
MKRQEQHKMTSRTRPQGITQQIDRRQLLRGGSKVGLGLLLRSLATGLPPAWIAGLSSARAQEAMVRPQTLIFATSSAGDPVNVNCPGAYVDGAENNPILESSRGDFGRARVRAAAPWQALPAPLRERLAFFHYSSRTAAHPEYASKMSFRGSVKNSAGNGAEMFASAVADLSAEPLGTLQREPVPLCREVLTIEGQPLQNLNPSELKALFAPQEDQLADLRGLRDDTLNALYAGLRVDGTGRQRRFVDRYLQSREQARSLGDQLGDLLARLPTDPDAVNHARDQVIAAVALARLNIAPVITIKIPFGGDNHQDSDLSVEAEQTISGVGHIQALWDELNAAGLEDTVSFALLNVFGRKFQRNNQGGRNHNRHHGVMIAFGAAIQGGVYGGVTGEGQALPIDPESGAGREGASVPVEETLEAAGRSLLAALGHSRETVERRIQGGAIVSPFLR